MATWVNYILRDGREMVQYNSSIFLFVTSELFVPSHACDISSRMLSQALALLQDQFHTSYQLNGEPQ